MGAQHSDYNVTVSLLPIGADANTSLSESFEYDGLNRLTESTVALNPTPLVATFSYNAIGNLTFKSDVGTYSYPAPGAPRPHGVTSVSGGVINTTFSAACPRVGGSRARGTPRAT